MKCLIYLVAIILIAIIWIPLGGDMRREVISGYNHLFKICINKHGEALDMGDKLEDEAGRTLYVILVTIAHFFIAVFYLACYSFMMFFFHVPKALFQGKFRDE